MKKRSLRILSLIVAIVMVVAMLPLSALAEETGPKRKVGVVVYGAELTAVLTDIESAFHGNVDFKKSLDQIVRKPAVLIELYRLCRCNKVS